MKNHDDYYLDVRFCPGCASYVPYLRSPDSAWCVWCGDEVRLFSAEDHARFRDDVRRGRPLGRRWGADEVA